MISNWIYEENLLPFLEVLANISDYKFNSDDWVTIEYGIKNTNTDANPERWFDYSFGGTSFSVGKDQGASVVFFRIDTNKSNFAAIETAFFVMCSYRVTKYNS